MTSRHSFKHFLKHLITGLVIGISGCVVHAASPPGDPPVPQGASWRPRHISFNYFGVTSRYTCDAMERKVRGILRFLGARPDVQVTATDCPYGSDSISRSISVTADFNTLVAAPGDAASTGLIANWVPMRLSTSRPYFMDDGDCELVDQLRKVLTDNFSWRGQVSVSASCPMNSVAVNDYRVEGEVLEASPASVIHRSGG